MKSWQALGLLCLLAPACATTDTSYRAPIERWQESHPETVEPEDAAQTAELPPHAQLPELLDHARRHNPKLRQAFFDWRAAVERIPQAGRLPDPRVLFGVFLEEVETRTGPMQGKFTVSQALPWFGKRALAGDVAAARADAVGEGVAAALLQVDREVRDAWYEYAWLHRAVEVSKAHRELLKHWQDVARTRLELGLSKPSEILRVELELGQLEDRLLSLADLERPLRARINAALDRDLNAPLDRPEFPLIGDLELDGEALLAGLAESNPELRRLSKQVTAANKGSDLADLAGRPDLVLGVDYTQIGSNGAAGSGDDAVALTVGFGLPVWRGVYRAEREEARAKQMAARLAMESAHNRLRSELEMALFQWRDKGRHLELLNGSLIPKGQEAIGIMGDTYQNGESSFIDV
ncbi:MAG: TolC family protein, partial [Planctomycetes bacterium]|nr:TolC family protein [Planctomycetota bacterium]